MGSKPSVAVIGSGYWGKNLVRNYHQLGALKLICDRNETLIGQFKTQYPDVEVCLAYNDLLSRSDIDAVVIATPAESHFTLACEALLSKKHVYVEKPLVLDESEAVELIDLADREKRVLMVGHLLQYHPVFVRLKELVKSGELGRIDYIYSNRLNLGKIRREENILWSFAPHDISMILALAGEEPETVTATGANYLHKKIADVTTTHLEFPSGIHAHIFVSWLHPFKEQKLVVVGKEKMAVFDDTQPWEEKLLIYPHRIRWESNLPVPDKAEPERIDIPRSEPLKSECVHFLECIIDGGTPITDGREGLRVLKVLKAAQDALDNPPTRVFNTAVKRRETTPSYFAHETALIEDDVEIGTGTKIWHFSHILTDTRIGESCNIGQNVVIGPSVSVGKSCKIQNNVSVYKGVTLEDGVFCGPSMVFTNIYNPRAEMSKMDQVRPTLVKHGATLGANSTIVCGVTIGRYAFVGAGTVVNRNVPDHALVVGNPGKIIGWVCECGERLSDDLECLSCGKHYAQNQSGVAERPALIAGVKAAMGDG